MPGQESHTATLEVDSQRPEGEASGSVVDVSYALMILTWVTFTLVTLILYKVAWRPILRALDAREDSIRKALEGAEKANRETAEIEAKRESLMRDAEVESGRILAGARVAAEAAATRIQTAAHEEARQLVDTARRDIAAAVESARSELRKETAGLAVDLAGRFLKKTVDSEEQRRMMKDLEGEL